MAKAFKILLFSCIIVVTILFIKYKPAFKVELSGEEIGYIDNKDDIEDTIQDYLDNKENNIAFIETEDMPDYTFKFVDKNEDINEEDVLLAVKDQSTVIYRSFVIKLNGEEKETVKTIEEAETVINKIKEEYDKDIELDLTIEELYTEENPNNAFVETEIATADLGGVITNKIEEIKIAEKIANSESVFDGVYLSRPISGKLTSRFGERSSIRSSTHTGLDIAAPYGTKIFPVAEGTVTYAGTKGSYGKLVIISHGNGIESYYGHCSSIYVEVGQEVDTKKSIAAVRFDWKFYRKSFAFGNKKKWCAIESTAIFVQIKTSLRACLLI